MTKGEPRIVSFLLRHGADSNRQNPETGKTPLHLAVELDNPDLVRILMKHEANPHIKDHQNRTAIGIASSEIKNQLSRSPKNDSERSTHNSLLIFPFPDTIEIIPSIPLESFTTLNLSPVSNTSFKILDTSAEKSHGKRFNKTMEPEAEKPLSEMQLPKTYSFGGHANSLLRWLESVKLEFLYDNLMHGGYDDMEQMMAQMMSALPITEEMLESIGVKKPGYRRRLLAALDEEARPMRSKRIHRHHQSNPLRYCLLDAPTSHGLLSAPELSQWLARLSLDYLLKAFVMDGYEDLEHNLAIMNSKWPITESILKNELLITKQAHRYKILAALRSESLGFDSFKKTGGVVNRPKNGDINYERTTNSASCDSCLLM